MADARRLRGLEVGDEPAAEACERRTAPAEAHAIVVAQLVRALAHPKDVFGELNKVAQQADAPCIFFLRVLSRRT